MILPPPRYTLFPYTTLFRSYKIDDEMDPTARIIFAKSDQAFAALERLHPTQTKAELEEEWKARLRTMIESKLDRKSTRLNSSHQIISYAVFCLKKKTNKQRH